MKSSLLLFVCFPLLLSAQPVLYNNDALLSETASGTNDQFRLHRGIILVEATVNGEAGTFILDTGAPDIILNSLPEDPKSGAGLHGRLSSESTHIETLRWQNTDYEDVPALRIDLDHLQAKTATPLRGLLGHGVLADRQLEIDYRNRRLQLSASTRQNRPAHRHRLPIRMYGHLPVVHVKIKGKSFRFALDTGAAVNLFAAGAAKRMQLDLRSETPKTIYGAGGSETLVAASVAEFSLARQPAQELNGYVADLSHLHRDFDLPIDGILGYEFLKQYHFTIDYRRRQLYLH